MTDEQRARRNARARWRRKNNPESHAKELARQRGYRAKNPEKFREQRKKWRNHRPGYMQEWYKSHPDYMSEWRKAHPEQYKKSIIAWRAAHRDRVRELEKRSRQNCREWIQLASFMRYQKMCELFRVDAEAYAKHREDCRKREAKQMAKAGKTYRGKPAQRIPDWAVMGQDLMRRSTMTVNALGNDLERQNRGYRNELIKERYGDK